jgi:hypothetical protein
MTTPTNDPAQTGAAGAAYIHLESRPARLNAARYDRLPFPNNGPVQEIAFDIGVTAYQGAIVVSGLVIQGYDGHQLLFEQRWTAPMIQQRTGEADLTIPPDTGLAIRGLHILLHGYATMTTVEVTVVGAAAADGRPLQSALTLPVVYPTAKTDLHFPLRGAWWAIQAADWSDRHKQEVFSQTYAIDFVKLGVDNQFFRNPGMQLEDHYSWGQPVYATAGGKVAYVCYDMPDLLPGVPPNPLLFRHDMRRILGNAVAISHGNGEFSYFAHLQQASIEVREGQMVRRGARIGRVGNSGQSPGPHLHFSLLEGPNLFLDQALPVQFSHFSAGGQFFDQPITIPTRMIVFGPADEEEGQETLAELQVAAGVTG